MAEKVTVKAAVREGRGKEDSKKMRREGRIPVIVYGAGKDAVSVSVQLSELAAILRSDTGGNTLFALDIEGEGASDVIFQDRQIDPLKGRLIHADLRRFAAGEKIEVTVAIHITGNAAGLTEEGAVMVQQLREIKVLCEPKNIPETINVDVTNLGLGDSIHVKDLPVGEGIEVHEDPETIVVTISFVAEQNLESAVEAGVEPVVEGEEKAPAEGDAKE
jgi:large subunit ribosomal protein L25